jgi:hypothetical protein
MKNVVTVASIVVFASVAALVLAHHGPDTVTLDAAMDKKGPVEFPHAAHIEVVESCDTCHHTNEGLTAETDADVQPCSACHLDPESPDTPSLRQMSMSKNPMHAGCIDCHKQEAKGPTKCADCHAKGE